MSVEHYELARKLRVPHGEAVKYARTFCPSGHGAGSHGSLCPCDNCTETAVRRLASKRDAGLVRFHPLEQLLANLLARR